MKEVCRQVSGPQVVLVATGQAERQSQSSLPQRAFPNVVLVQDGRTVHHLRVVAHVHAIWEDICHLLVTNIYLFCFSDSQKDT